jgi:hypothetical protein
MTNIFSKIKKIVLEPKIYTILVSSSKGQILYLGMHYSLEEAYASARLKLETLSPHGPGDSIDIDLWNMVTVKQILLDSLDLEKEELVAQNIRSNSDASNIVGFNDLPPMIKELILNPSKDYKPIEVEIEIEEEESRGLEHYVKDLKESRNDLMKKLIDEGDVSKVEEFKTLLGSYARKYVLKAIKDKRSDSKKIN